jgi:hypothetical protein
VIKKTYIESRNKKTHIESQGDFMSNDQRPIGRPPFHSFQPYHPFIRYIPIIRSLTSLISPYQPYTPFETYDAGYGPYPTSPPPYVPGY